MKSYFRELTETVGSAWNRFWFSARDPYTLCILRILVGLLGIFYLVSHTADLVDWFSGDGILPTETARRLAGAEQSRYFFRYSYLFFANTAAELYALHVIGLVVFVAFAAGLWTRVTSVLAVIVALSYVHRAPMITGQFEPVLTMLLVYLCLAPTGRYLSIDSWRRRRSSQTTDATADNDNRSVMANIATRLIQVHLAAFYLMIGLNMLSADTWWTGEAMWWLIARSESRLVDLTGIGRYPLLTNLWTHLVVAYQFAFGLLIWPRILRPLLLMLGLLVWIPLGLVTGLLAYAAIMLAASVVFVDPARWRIDRVPSDTDSS
jgi:hypothetical protein